MICTRYPLSSDTTLCVQAGYSALDYEGNSQLSRKVHCLLQIPLEADISVHKSHHSFELSVEAVRTELYGSVKPSSHFSSQPGMMGFLDTDQIEVSTVSRHAPVMPETLAAAASAHPVSSDRPSAMRLKYRSSISDEKDQISNASLHVHHVAFSSVVY
jgi:hypothetical protein